VCHAASVTTHPRTDVRARDWLPLWLALAAIWGSSFMLIKIGLEGFNPLQLGTLRTTSGAVTVVLVVVLLGQRLPSRRTAWLHSSIVGLLLAGFPAVLFAWAETRVTSVLAGLFNAATPLFTALAGLLIARGQHIGRNRAAGLALGIVGVGLMLGLWQGLSGSLAGSAAAIGATICYGIGIQWQQRFLTPRPESPESLVAAQLIVASGALLAVDAVSGSLLSTQWQLRPTIAVVILGSVGTGLAFVMFYRVLRVAGALTAATITYATPVVSTLLGIVLLGEVVTWNQPAGAILVLTGVALVQGFLRPFGGSPPKAPTPPPASQPAPHPSPLE
jgi:drug/metabolite transporter (DMT)-like permease